MNRIYVRYIKLQVIIFTKIFLWHRSIKLLIKEKIKILIKIYRIWHN